MIDRARAKFREELKRILPANYLVNENDPRAMDELVREIMEAFDRAAAEKAAE